MGSLSYKFKYKCISILKHYSWVCSWELDDIIIQSTLAVSECIGDVSTCFDVWLAGKEKKRKKKTCSEVWKHLESI